MSEEETINQLTGDSQQSTENKSVKSESSIVNEETEKPNAESETQKAVTQPLTINNEPVTNMEVHHPHHVTHKKKWGEYLLEFFMLFLAVFLGFVAENIREHNVDKTKEKELILALSQDLIKDTVRLHHLIDVYTPAYHSWVDSAHYAIDSLPLKGNEKRISKALFNSTFWFVYTPPAIAITIVQNPVSFNLIKNETVKKEIQNYNVSINDYNKYSEFLSDLQHSVDTAFASLVNREASRKFLDKLNERLFFLSDIDVPDSIVFNTYDKSAFKTYIKKLDQMDFKIHDVHFFCQDILKEDIKLLNLLKEHYHLD